MSPLLRRIQSDGFVDLDQFDPDLPPGDAVRDIAKTVGATVLVEPQELTVSEAGSKGLNTFGGNYGLRKLPIHTDLAHWYRPPRYVMLRCVVGSPIVSTQLLHYRDLEPVVPIALMKRAMFSPRRRLDGKMYLLHMLADQVFRWDELFLVPKNRPALEVRRLMLEGAERIRPTNIVLERPGQALVIDNWQALHGRSAVPTAATERRLERIYMEETEDGHEDTT